MWKGPFELNPFRSVQAVEASPSIPSQIPSMKPPTLLNPPRPHLSGLPEVIYKAEIKWRERLTISENVQYSAQHLWTQRAAQTLRSSIEAILGHRKSCRPEQNPADTVADCRRLQSRKKGMIVLSCAQRFTHSLTHTASHTT